MQCTRCKKDVNSISSIDSMELCDECYKTYKREKIECAAENINRSSDFKNWKGEDLSELFWICLGRYVKEPNDHDRKLMRMAYLWAVHDNHGLANSMSHALKWAKVIV